MIRLVRSLARVNISRQNRSCGTSIAAAKPAAAPAAAVKEAPKAAPAKEGGFLNRFASFLVGVGFGFGANMWFLHEELTASNKQLDQSVKEIDQRLSNLESK